MGLSDTQDNALRKVWLTKVFGKSKKTDQVIMGWETAAPVKGKPYTVYLSRGRAFRTSRVETLKEEPKGLMIKTVNSLYHVEYA